MVPNGQDFSAGSGPESPKSQRYGATYLFDKVCELNGITQSLAKTFPDDYRGILSLAYYLAMEGNLEPRHSFGQWAAAHKHP